MMMGVLELRIWRSLRFLSGCGLVGRALVDGHVNFRFAQFCFVCNLLSYEIRNKMSVYSAPTAINMAKCAKYWFACY